MYATVEFMPSVENRKKTEKGLTILVLYVIIQKEEILGDKSCKKKKRKF